MPVRKGLLAPQNTFLDTIATRFDGTHSNFVLGNAQVIPSYPIVYCSDGFCELTGFVRAEVMQKSCACKFLYGNQTEEEKIEEIEKSLENKVELKTEVMFRTKEGSEFCCLLDIVPIRNEKGEVVLFLASHKDITHTKMSTFMFKDGDNDEDDEDDIHTDLFGDEKPPNGIYQRRRSRAVLYHLSGHLKEQEKKRRKLKLNSTLLAPKQTNLPEYKVAAMQKSQFIFLHYSTFKTIWDCIILLATLYIAVIVPYNVSFLSDVLGMNKTSKTLVPDIIVEILFILDLVINFRTTFVSKDGTVIYHPPQIAINYLKTWFFIDLVAAIPFDLITLIAKIDTVWGNIGMLKIVRLLRLLRVKIDRYSQYSAIVLACLTFGFGLLAHWLACIWYVIGRKEIDKHLNATTPWEIGWINELTESLGQTSDANLTLQSKYVTALYYTLSSMTSVGFGNVSANTDAEKIFTIIVMIIGALSHAAVFGNVTALIQRMYARRALYHSKCKDLKDFIQSHNIPLDLKNRMQDYFQTSWSVNMGIDTIEMLQMFPEELRADISMHLNREILSLPIFQEASQGCRRSLSLRVKSAFSAPGEYLIHKGDALNMIYFVLNGSLEVLRSGMVAAILGKGDLFGCDLYDTDSIIQSNGDVHALTYCDIQSISRQSLIEVLQNYPEYLGKFKEEIARDLTFNLREGADYESDKISFGNLEKNVARSRLPSINEDDETRGTIPTRTNNNDTKETSFKEKGVHLEVNTCNSSGLPPELSPRVVDGIEDEKQYKCQSFEFHDSVYPRRRSSSHPENPKGLLEHYDNDMQMSFVSPQLAVHRSCSTESMNTEELRHEIESTRNSVERLDKQVFSLSQDVTNLSQDLKSILRLLHVISPLPASPNSPDAIGTNHLQTPPKVLTVKIEQSGNQRYEDIIHVQRQDGLLETSIGSGILASQDNKEPIPEKQCSKNPTNVTLLPHPSERVELGRPMTSTKSREDDSGQYDSENGTEL
ncbi:voltage-gated delayed rectifier potassium channel KCNH8-like [Antedon mediterranea]|uniref:voltage-gated delayed rectifier potassium channel KCNH8-like n=1 Tax=Antedon mediterranea TaxID=105859 RepID=UPI003AF44965